MAKKDYSEYTLEDYYQDWQEQLYLKADQDTLDELEKLYYMKFQELSVIPTS